MFWLPLNFDESLCLRSLIVGLCFQNESPTSLPFSPHPKKWILEKEVKISNDRNLGPD